MAQGLPERDVIWIKREAIWQRFVNCMNRGGIDITIISVWKIRRLKCNDLPRFTQ